MSKLLLHNHVLVDEKSGIQVVQLVPSSYSCEAVGTCQHRFLKTLQPVTEIHSLACKRGPRMPRIQLPLLSCTTVVPTVVLPCTYPQGSRHPSYPCNVSLLVPGAGERLRTGRSSSLPARSAQMQGCRSVQGLQRRSRRLWLRPSRCAGV